MKKFVAYYRVSTKKQGSSGLGLEAQKTTVINFIGNDNNLIAEFIEIESGKNDNRIELKKAIEYAKNNNATLVIAKLDRLSRNVSFIFQLRDSQVDFTCCDIPDANTMTIGIFALLAQQERELISTRTKQALAEKKKQGIKLGSPQNLTNDMRKKGREKLQRIAENNINNQRAKLTIKHLLNSGMSYNQIAIELNNSGFRTSKNCYFQATSVMRLAKAS